MSRNAPVLTLAVTVVTGVVAGLAFLNPGLQAAMRRDPAALQSGAWWRLATPLLVRTDAWIVLLVILVGTVAAGYAVEHDAGRWRWLALYLGSGLVGQAFGYAWDPRGAGSSVAVLGLFAWIWYATWRQHTDLRIKLIGVCGLAALAAVAAADVVADPIWVSAVVAVAVGGAGVNVVRRLPASAAGLLFGWLGVLLGVALTVLHDNHGPAVLAGLLVAGLLDRRRLPLVSAQLDN